MTALGTSATTVGRHVPKHIASLPDLSIEIKISESLVCMVAFETWECLMKRSVPLIRLDISSSTHLDRLIGVTHGLLPLLYDVCELCHAVFHAVFHAEECDKSRVLAASSTFEQQIQLWQLCFWPDFAASFTKIEVVHMLAQTEVYRNTGLLFIHRLRHTFGSDDANAESFFRKIIVQLHMALTATQEPVRCVKFPRLDCEE